MRFWVDEIALALARLRPPKDAIPHLPVSSSFIPAKARRDPDKRVVDLLHKFGTNLLVLICPFFTDNIFRWRDMRRTGSWRCSSESAGSWGWRWRWRRTGSWGCPKCSTSMPLASSRGACSGSKEQAGGVMTPLPARPHLKFDECVMIRAMSRQAVLGPADLGGAVLVRGLFFQTALRQDPCGFRPLVSAPAGSKRLHRSARAERAPRAHAHAHQHTATRTIGGQID